MCLLAVLFFYICNLTKYVGNMQKVEVIEV